MNRLISHKELIIILCSGVSLWKILANYLFAASIISMIIMLIINPIGAYGLREYDALEDQLLKKRPISLILKESGGFFAEEYNNIHRLISARSINIELSELYDINVLFLDPDNNFVQRIDAQKAKLSNDKFLLTKVTVITKNDIIKKENDSIATNLSMIDISTQFTMPQMISIYNLKSFIATLLKFGSPSLNHKIYYYKQLLKPIMMIANVLLAICFIKPKDYRNSQNHMSIIGLFVGFISYATIEFITKILASIGLDPFLAILSPIILMILVAIFVILHLHEG
jgi:lipopolysaccharide export system permease protein